MSESLKGQVALVTGASRGIGAATAKILARTGAHVILTARTAKDLESVEEEIFQAGGSATIAPLDLTDPESIGRLATAISERWDALDIMILNAAMLGNLAPVQHLNAKEFAQIFTLNVSAQQAMIAAFDPMLRRSEHARIIGVTSSVGEKARAYWGAYGASKAAFENLLTTYAEENENISKIRVGIVDPGATRTKMRALAYPGEDPASVKAPEIVGERILSLLSEQFDRVLRVRINQ
jgi:NAD(P)-dependent dehydrogenase (short-subunit alcohol dehydrogenase family)